MALGMMVGPLLLTTAFTLGVDFTNIPDCENGDNAFYLAAAAPWFVSMVIIFICIALLPIGNRLDPDNSH